ncbi:FecR domain-containing protein [Chrysiogenes arsenatis]|uniref:FecR domain-containing protein n=1 Tax=Chrysiogenes arsenatis TaxID=309797 RepID=UPI000425E482|nr:FecR domain-containing protein [Chrysiogenes arsenatis]
MRNVRAILLCFLVFFLACKVWAAPIGRVAALEGSAEAVAADGVRRALAIKGDIFQNDTVLTQQNGKVQLMFTDNSVFTIGPNSELVVDTFVFDPNQGAGESAIQVTKGAFRFVTGKIARNDFEKMRVNTPTATIGIRGTLVAGNQIDGGELQVALLGGAIAVASSQGAVEITTPGFGTSVTPGAAPQIPTQWSAEQLNAVLSATALEGQEGGTPEGGAEGGDAADGENADNPTQQTEGAQQLANRDAVTNSDGFKEAFKREALLEGGLFLYRAESTPEKAQGTIMGSSNNWGNYFLAFDVAGFADNLIFNSNTYVAGSGNFSRTPLVLPETFFRGDETISLTDATAYTDGLGQFFWLRQNQDELKFLAWAGEDPSKTYAMADTIRVYHLDAITIGTDENEYESVIVLLDPHTGKSIAIAKANNGFSKSFLGLGEMRDSQISDAEIDDAERRVITLVHDGSLGTYTLYGADLQGIGGGYYASTFQLYGAGLWETALHNGNDTILHISPGVFTAGLFALENTAMLNAYSKAAPEVLSEYLTWGAWLGSAPAEEGNVTDFRAPWIAGTLATQEVLAGKTTAAYSGTAYGTAVIGENMYALENIMTTSIDFASKNATTTLNSASTGEGYGHLEATYQSTLTGAVLAGSSVAGLLGVSGESASAITGGALKGGIYGDGSVIGGIYQATSSAGTASGVFGGMLTTPNPQD